MNPSEVQKAVLATVENELKHDLVLQRNKFARIQPQTILVPCAGSTKGDSAQMKILISQDGDFTIHGLQITARGPVDANGKVVRGVLGADFRQTAFPSGLRASNDLDLAGSGVMVQITEAGTGLRLTDGFVELSAIASPGYINTALNPVRFKHTLRKNVTLVLDFRNKDDARVDGTDTTTAAYDLFHLVTVALIGEKYQGVNAGV